MNSKSNTLQIYPPVRLSPTPRVASFIASFTTPGLRSFAQAMCADHQSSNVLSIVTHIDTVNFRVVTDELLVVADSIGRRVPVLLRPCELDQMAVALIFLRTCFQNAGEESAFLLCAWDDSVRRQLRLLNKCEPSLSGLLRPVLGMANEDDLEPQGIQELRLHIKLGLEGVHRRYPKLAAHVQNHLLALNTLHD